MKGIGVILILILPELTSTRLSIRPGSVTTLKARRSVFRGSLTFASILAVRHVMRICFLLLPCNLFATFDDSHQANCDRYNRF